MGKAKIIKEKIISSIVDLSLVSIYFGIGFAGSGVTNQRLKTEKTVNSLYHDVNYESIKRAYRYLKKKGLIEYIKEKEILPQITAEGKKRLENLLPKYDTERTWDKRVYLVIYDIPKNKNTTRNAIRDYLKKIGCGKLQGSVWLTPYNPTKLIEEFIEKHGLELDSIIISSIGKDGTVDSYDLTDLIEKVYDLRALNAKYQEFLDTNDPTIYISTLSIDPQLPFDILPSYWIGDDAYSVFKNMAK